MAKIARLGDYTPRHRRTRVSDPAPHQGTDPMVLHFPAAGPDSNWSLIAADLVRCGGQPVELHSLPGMDEETATGLSALMLQHAAAGIVPIAAASS
jgi:hypothetical protein